MTKFKPEGRLCKHCNKRFVAMRFWAKFCSDACRIAYWRKTHPYISPEDLKQINEKLKDVEQIKEKLGMK